MDAIDRVVMNTRLHYLGSAARIVEPVQRLAVLTCMDARVDINAVLGLRPGDAHVIRNAGGRATDDARHALALSQAAAGTREIMVVHHTECLLGRFKQKELADKIAAATGHRFDKTLTFSRIRSRQWCKTWSACAATFTFFIGTRSAASSTTWPPTR